MLVVGGEGEEPEETVLFLIALVIVCLELFIVIVPNIP